LPGLRGKIQEEGPLQPAAAVSTLIAVKFGMLHKRTQTMNFCDPQVDFDEIFMVSS